MISPYSIVGIVILMMTSSVFGIFMYEECRNAWRRWRKPADFRLTLCDGSGRTIRETMLPAEGISRLIRDLNSGFYE